MYLIVFALFAAINIGIAWLNNNTRINRIKHGTTAQINHAAWAVMYTTACLSVWLFFHNLLFCAALFPLHLSVFPVYYNFFSELPIFNLSKTSTALTDRLMVKIGLKDTALVNVAALVASIFLLWLSQ